MSNPIPALCSHCGLLFAKTNFIAGTATVTFVGGHVRCPNCRAWADILDGTYQLMGDAVRVLAATKPTAEILRKLADSLNEARKRKASPEEIFATIKEHVPELSKLPLPRTPSDLYPAIQALCAIIMTLATLGGIYLSIVKEKPSAPINQTIINFPQAASPSDYEKRNAVAQRRRKPKPKKCVPKRGAH